MRVRTEIILAVASGRSIPVPGFFHEMMGMLTYTLKMSASSVLADMATALNNVKPLLLALDGVTDAASTLDAAENFKNEVAQVLSRLSSHYEV